jgi:sugar (pentulose or hexulose) kinase
MKELFLGLDCSTQSFKGVVIDFNDKIIISKKIINYDSDLPQYNT